MAAKDNTLTVGQIGAAIIITFTDQVLNPSTGEYEETPIDISGATTKDVLLDPPTGALKTFGGSFVTDGTDGKLVYNTAAAADVDAMGTWKAQGHIVKGGADYKSQPVTFEVLGNLA